MLSLSLLPQPRCHAQVDAIAECIRQLGLAPTKARNLKAMSQVSFPSGIALVC